MPTQKDYSLLINKTYKNPSTGKTFKIKGIRPDGRAEMTEIGDALHIETILNNWVQVNESENEVLICG